MATHALAAGSNSVEDWPASVVGTLAELSMIISQTPFRVSFAGGGTDLREFYSETSGAVLSVAIRQHMYVAVHGRLESNFRLSYSVTEVAPTIDEIRHDIVRETLRIMQVNVPLELTTIADVPAGTGLGSSSSLTVGLLNALAARCGRRASAAWLARRACEVEIDRLRRPIGKQDQYAAAFGGLNYFRFEPDDNVSVEHLTLGPALRAEFERHALLVYTGQQRSADAILEGVRLRMGDTRARLIELRDCADEMKTALCSGKNLSDFGRLLHDAWTVKRSLDARISTEQVDAWYAAARAAGAWGGKLLGAGGGGFALLFAPPERHAAILDNLGRPRSIAFQISELGSRIVVASNTTAAEFIRDPAHD